jgi:hypothetical protein
MTFALENLLMKFRRMVCSQKFVNEFRQTKALVQLLQKM